MSLDFCKYLFHPSFIITGTKTDEKFIEALKRPHTSDFPEYQVKFQKASEYGYDSAKKKVGLIRKIVQEDSRYLDELIDPSIERPEMVKATGGLIAYIQNNRLECGEISGDAMSSCIQKIEVLSLYVQ